MKVTIAIPSYNRNEILLRTVEHLIPQLTADCQLLVIDNCSPVPIADTLADLLSDQVRVVRNRTNIGANSNVMRCFELCETEWMWLLGDDDTPTPDAIEAIFRKLNAHSDCIYVNFLGGGYDGLETRAGDTVLKGQREFLDRVDSIANVFFISTGLYNIAEIGPNIQKGYLYAHTQPNFVPFFVSLGEDRTCCLADAQIVTYNKPDDAQQWSVMYYALGVMTMLELPLEPDIRIALGKRILGSVHWHEMFVLQLLLLANKERDYRGALFLYDQLRARIYYYETNPVRRLKVSVYRTMIRFPFVSYSVIKWVKRDKAQRHVLSDNLNRS